MSKILERPAARLVPKLCCREFFRRICASIAGPEPRGRGSIRGSRHIAAKKRRQDDLYVARPQSLLSPRLKTETAICKHDSARRTCKSDCYRIRRRSEASQKSQR